MADAVLELIPSLITYQREIAKIPGMTDKAAAAAAFKLVAQMEKGAQKAGAAVAGAADDTAKEAAKGIANIGKAGKLAFPAMGELGEKVKGAIEGFTALGPAGLAVGAGVALAAVGAAAVGAAAGVVELTDAAHSYVSEIEKLQAAGVSLVTDDQIERVEAAHYAMEGLRTAGKAATIVFASEFGPAVERVATDALALVLVLRDSQDEIRAGAKALLSWADAAADTAQVLAPMLAMVPGMSGISSGLLAGAAAWEAMSGTITLAGGALDAVERGLPEYVSEAQKAIAAIRKLDEAQKGASKSARKVSDGEKDAAKALAEIARIQDAATERGMSPEGRILDTYAETTARLLDLQEQYGETSRVGVAAQEALLAATTDTERQIAVLHAQAAAERDKLDAEAQAKRAAEIAGRIAQERAWATASISSAASLAGSLGQIADAAVGESQDAQRRAFRFGQVAAGAQAAVNTALGVSEASSSAPWPYNLIPMAAQLVQGLAQEAAIWSVQPPQAYSGIDIPYASPTGTPVVVHPGESVRTRTETERDRRPQMVHVSTWIRGREVADTTAMEVRRGGALTAELTRRSGRLGRSHDYRST